MAKRSVAEPGNAKNGKDAQGISTAKHDPIGRRSAKAR